jgi:hypothetical protein
MSEAATLATPFSVEPGRVYLDWPAEVVPGEDGEPFTGTLALGHLGCGILSLLVVSGPARGRVAVTCDEPTGPLLPRDPDFLAWYERWLDAVLAGETNFW